MQISAKNQIKGKVTSVIHGTSYTQVAVEQTDADGNTTGSFIQIGRLNFLNLFKFLQLSPGIFEISY